MRLLDDVSEKIVDSHKKMEERTRTAQNNRWSVYSVFLLVANSVITLLMLVYVPMCNVSFSNSLEEFCTILAASMLIALVLFLEFYITYRHYRYRMPDKMALSFVIQGICIILLIAIVGLDKIIVAIVKIVAPDAFRNLLICIGSLSIVASVVHLAFSGRKSGSASKTVKRGTATQSDKELPLEAVCKRYRRAIQSNAITISFVEKQWEFMPGETVLFGYDGSSNNFVFLSDEYNKTINRERVTYLDYEDFLLDKTSGAGGMITGAILGGMAMGVYGAVVGGATGRLKTQRKNIQRIMKIYYLDRTGREQVLAFSQDFNGEYVLGDGGVDKLKKISDNSNSQIDEILFRCRIRHMGTTLDKKTYVARPFADDEWFVKLKGYLEKETNKRTNGYELFRQMVIDDERYMQNGTVITIVREMSKREPDLTSVKREIRSVCFQDTLSAIGENAKTTAKGLFRKK